MTGAGTTTSLTSLLPAYFIFGFGFGMINPPITNTAVLGMPPAQAGVAAAVASTSRQIGQTLGVAVAGAVAAAGAAAVGPGFVAGAHTGWWIVSVCGLITVVLGFASTTQWANASARRVAEELDAPVVGSGREVEPVGV
jgi:MFS family permease